MSKFDVVIGQEQIVFVDSKGKADKLDLFDAMDDSEAVRAIAAEQKAGLSASKGAVSLLTRLLNNPRLDGYKGQTPINEAVPAELKAAIREIETEYLKPIFCKPHADKGAKPATIEKLWQEYASGLKAGGSYAVAKSFVTMYFAHCGKLPTNDGLAIGTGSKLLTVAALKKLIENAKSDIAKPEKATFSSKLVQLSSELQTRDAEDNADLGNVGAAIHALREMLATFEGLQREESEAALVTYEAKNVGDIAAQSQAIVAKAYTKSKAKASEAAPF